MLFSHFLCGHFALGTLSKTYFNHAVFEINVLRKEKMTTSKSVKFATEIKNRIGTRYYFVSINTFYAIVIQC